VRIDKDGALDPASDVARKDAERLTMRILKLVRGGQRAAALEEASQLPPDLRAHVTREILSQTFAKGSAIRVIRRLNAMRAMRDLAEIDSNDLSPAKPKKTRKALRQLKDREGDFGVGAKDQHGVQLFDDIAGDARFDISDTFSMRLEPRRGLRFEDLLNVGPDRTEQTCGPRSTEVSWRLPKGVAKSVGQKRGRMLHIIGDDPSIEPGVGELSFRLVRVPQSRRELAESFGLVPHLYVQVTTIRGERRRTDMLGGTKESILHLLTTIDPKMNRERFMAAFKAAMKAEMLRD
jgi:hypothetical protein